MSEYANEDDFIDDLAEKCEKCDKAVKKIRNTLRALRAARNRALEEQLLQAESTANEIVQKTLKLIKGAPNMNNLEQIADNEEFQEIKAAFKKTVRSLNVCMTDVQNLQIDVSYDGSGHGASIQTQDAVEEQEPEVDHDNLELEMVFNSEQVDVDAEIAEENRQDAMQLAQDTVVLRDMMADTVEIIEEQGEQLKEVDQTVEDAAETTEKAGEALKAARGHQKSVQKIKIIIISVCACLVLTAIIILAIRFGAPAGTTVLNPPATTTTTTPPPSGGGAGTGGGGRRLLRQLLDHSTE